MIDRSTTVATSIVVVVPGNPVPYERADGRHGGGRRHSDRMRSYLELVRLCSWQAVGQLRSRGVEWPTSGVRYGVTVYLARETAHTCDVDNVLKSALDGATIPRGGVMGLWRNDSAIDDARVVRLAPSRDTPALVMRAYVIERRQLTIDEVLAEAAAQRAASLVRFTR